MQASAIRTAIIGFGVSAKVFHLPFVVNNPRYELVGFVERSGPKSMASYPACQSFLTLGEMLRVKPELVIISSPNQYHFEQAKLCLEADCHVLVEKPMSVTLTEAKELAALAQKRGKVLTVYHNRRLDGDFLTVSEIVASGCLGRLVEAEIRFDRWTPGIRAKPWKETGSLGSSLLEDLGSHLIDQALRLWGLPQSLTARLLTQRDQSQVADAFELCLHYADAAQSGLQVRLKGGMLVRPAMPRFTLFGTQGSFVKYGTDPQEAQLGAGQLPGSPGYGCEDKALWGELEHQLQPGTGSWMRSKVATQPGNYAIFHENLAQAIRQGAPLLVTPQEAVAVMQVIEAARVSSAERRSVTLNASA